jgi:hypothetical protein
VPFFHDKPRLDLRRMYAEAWRKRREGLPTEPLEAQIADVIAAHPEYHAMFEQAESVLDRDYTPEGGQTNPFLHLGLHLAIREQVATDRPPGIRAIHARLAGRHGDAHGAEHAMIECLAEALWQAQRGGTAPDEQAYLEALRRV